MIILISINYSCSFKYEDILKYIFIHGLNRNETYPEKICNEYCVWVKKKGKNCQELAHVIS